MVLLLETLNRKVITTRYEWHVVQTSLLETLNRKVITTNSPNLYLLPLTVRNVKPKGNHNILGLEMIAVYIVSNIIPQGNHNSAVFVFNFFALLETLNRKVITTIWIIVMRHQTVSNTIPQGNSTGSKSTPI